MGWKDLLRTETTLTAPWTGGRTVYASGRRTFQLEGKTPDEHGMQMFQLSSGRKLQWLGPSSIPVDEWFADSTDTVCGYLIGDRLAIDGSAVPPDIKKLFDCTQAVYLVEQGLERYARITAARHTDGCLYFLRQEFPLGPEEEVRQAYVDRILSVAHVPHVSPALDLAFRVSLWQRAEVDRVRAEIARRQREEEERAAAAERHEQMMKNLGDGAARRVVAVHDFESAARAALATSGATLLDHRKGYAKGEVVVQFRFKNRRFECVCEQSTLRIVDSGICLIDHATGERGDSRFTLESLPGVIQQAMTEGRLVVFRHVG